MEMKMFAAHFQNENSAFSDVTKGTDTSMLFPPFEGDSWLHCFSVAEGPTKQL